MKKILPLLSILFFSGAALADDAALQKCRAVSDASARLRCYDAIPLAAAASAAPTAAAAVAPVAKAAPAATTAEQNFGIEQMKKKQTEEEPKSIESTIVGNFDGWGPNSRIKLANGQVWRIVDGSDAVLTPMQNPKARIERNMFGTMFLHVEGTNSSAKVRRVQ